MTSTHHRSFLSSIAMVFLCTTGLQIPMPLVHADNGLDSDKPSVEVVRRLPNPDRAIALTFDDGPSETFTPQVLNILNQYHARATFFVIGSRIERFPDLIRQELAQDNEIGNHSYSHTVLQDVPTKAVETELNKSQHAMRLVTGHDGAHLFRPPRGRFGESVVKAASHSGYSVILWSVDSGDWSNPGTRTIVKHVLHDVHSGDVLLFHDQGGDRTQTIQALESIIPELERRGFELVTISELIEKAHPSQFTETRTTR